MNNYNSELNNNLFRIYSKTVFMVNNLNLKVKYIARNIKEIL